MKIIYKQTPILIALLITEISKNKTGNRLGEHLLEVWKSSTGEIEALVTEDHLE